MMTAQIPQRRAAFTLVEILISVATGLMLLTVLASTAMTLQRSLLASEHFVRSSNDGQRLLDSVAQDLRRAVRISQYVNGVKMPFKNNVSLAVSETVTLAINVPDFYRSNMPDRAPESPFRTSRYDRQSLNLSPTYNGNGASLLNGVIYWKEAVAKVNNVETTRFAPGDLATGEVQVRYFRGPRSAKDSTPCYFRGEYPPTGNTPYFPPEEIAERIETGGDYVALRVDAPNFIPSDARYGKVFRLKCSFTPRYRRATTSVQAAEQELMVFLRNARRD